MTDGKDDLLRELFGTPGAELGGKVGRAIDWKIQSHMMTVGAKMREMERKIDELQAMCDRLYLESEKQREHGGNESAEGADCTDDGQDFCKA